MIHRIVALGLALPFVIQPLGCFRQELGPFEGDIRGVLHGRLVHGIVKRKLLPFGINGQELVKISIEEYEKDGRSFSSDFGKILDWKRTGQCGDALLSHHRRPQGRRKHQNNGQLCSTFWRGIAR